MRETGGLLGRLRFDAGERYLSLGFDHADSLDVEVEQVVGRSEPGFHGRLTGGNAASAREVEFVEILNKPPSGLDVRVGLAAARCSGVLVTSWESRFAETLNEFRRRQARPTVDAPPRARGMASNQGTGPRLRASGCPLFALASIAAHRSISASNGSFSSSSMPSASVLA